MFDKDDSATTESTSLRDDIIAAMSGADAQEAPQDNQEVEAAPEEAEGPKSERARDEHGKFVKQAEADKPAEIPEVKADKPETETAPQQEAIDAPKSWNAEARALFAKADPALREYIAKRDREQADGVAKLKSQYEGKARFADELWSEIAPYQGLIQAEGGTPAGAVRELLKTAAIFRTGSAHQKANALVQIARDYGVSLDVLNTPEARPDPHLSAIQQELAQLKGFVSQTQQAALSSEIETFKAGAPHFDEVRPMMAALLETGQAETLQDAYDKAVYANPSVRAKVLAEQQAKAVKEQAAKASQVSMQAKAKAVSVTGAPGGSAAKDAPPEDLRALIAQQVYGDGRA